MANGMQGFDYEKARTDLEIRDNFDVMAMIGIGISEDAEYEEI